VVVAGSLGLVLILAFLPFLPGNFAGRLVLGFLIVVFGFFFVTVASRIVGLIGTTSNPISGMTIATLMATCLFFVGIGWTGDVYQPMALCVGGMVAIAAANAGATSQDLKTGFLVGATPRAQQIGLMIGAVAAAMVIGFTLKALDNPSVDPATGLLQHGIGSEKYPAPQGTLMATIIRGLLAHNLDWQFVLVGVFAALTVELCGVSPLSFAVGAYLPLSTTLPIFVGGAIKGIVDRRSGVAPGHGDDLGPGSLFATGLVAGGTLTGTVVAFLHLGDRLGAVVDSADISGPLTRALGAGGYQILGVACFALMGLLLYRVARRPMTGF
jgi:putative OPT family oligopeptide transporter